MCWGGWPATEVSDLDGTKRFVLKDSAREVALWLLWLLWLLRRSHPRYAVHRNHMSEKSPFRLCRRDLMEFLKCTRWAFLVQVDYFRVARDSVAAPRVNAKRGTERRYASRTFVGRIANESSKQQIAGLRCFPIEGVHILGSRVAEQQQRIIRS
jgi:hypothetical protein